MGHYALINHDNVVVQVFVGKDEFDPLPEGIESWERYYCPDWAKACLRTSYNTAGGQHPGGPDKAFRGNYAGIGFTYDEELDAFIPPRPEDSWRLNRSTFLWEPTAPSPVNESRVPSPEPGQESVGQ